MKIVRFEYQGQIHRGLVEGTDIELTTGQDFTRTGRSVPLDAVRLLSPVEPPNVLALGLNYRRHATETQMKVPERPLLFIKANTSVIGPSDAILLPKIAPLDVDYEAELCLVIGKRAKNLSEDEALGCVLGYTCGND
ncbi:MAG: fumarylacetoacetate hydrolase family protein, partial [Armatimonadota bacterium]